MLAPPELPPAAPARPPAVESVLGQLLLVHGPDALPAHHPEHIAKARPDILRSEPEHLKVPLVVQGGTGEVEFAADRVDRHDKVLGEIDLRHIALDVPGFPDGLKSLGTRDGLGLDRLLVLD